MNGIIFIQSPTSHGDYQCSWNSSSIVCTVKSYPPTNQTYFVNEYPNELDIVTMSCILWLNHSAQISVVCSFSSIISNSEYQLPRCRGCSRLACFQFNIPSRRATANEDPRRCWLPVPTPSRVLGIPSVPPLAWVVVRGSNISVSRIIRFLGT